MAGTQWRDREGREPAAIEQLVELDGKHVLEVGSGTGRLTRFVAARAASMHAFDPNADSVRDAEASLARVTRPRALRSP